MFKNGQQNVCNDRLVQCISVCNGPCFFLMCFFCLTNWLVMVDMSTALLGVGILFSKSNRNFIFCCFEVKLGAIQPCLISVGPSKA